MMAIEFELRDNVVSGLISPVIKPKYLQGKYRQALSI